MIIIVDNGNGAEEIGRFIRAPKKIVKPSEATSTKGTGYILTDGDVKHMKHNIDLIKKVNVPILAIGHGYVFLGTAYGATHKTGKVGKSERINIERPCPLLVDMKKNLMVMKSCKSIFEDLPENFDVVATSKGYDFEIIQESEKPFFGTQFNPELGGDGLKMIDNFAKFVEIWGKYHK